MLGRQMSCPSSTERRLEILQIWADEVDRSAAEHMACDESLLALSWPTLRLYRWSHEAVSVGTMASAGEAAAFAGQRPWVRRWTGGGMVEHGKDLTLALAVQHGSISQKMNASEWYRWIHHAALDALRSSFPSARLASPPDFESGSQCFQSPVCADVMLGDRKILGGALRKTRDGVLYQGSLQNMMPPEDFSLRFGSALAESPTPWSPTDEFFLGVRDLQKARYEAEDWIFRHH